MLRYELLNALQPQLKIELFPYNEDGDAKSIRFMADFENEWFEADSVEYQPVVEILTHLYQIDYEFDFNAAEEQLLASLSALQPFSSGRLGLKTAEVDDETAEYWFQRLEFTEGDRGVPFPFIHIYPAGKQAAAGELSPIPLWGLEEWVSHTDFETIPWRKNRKKVLRWSASKTPLQHRLADVPARPLRRLNQMAQTAIGADPQPKSTQALWRVLLLGMAKVGLLPASSQEMEDFGKMGLELVEGQHKALAQVREAVIALQNHADIIPGIQLDEEHHPLQSPLSPRWFIHGPFQSDGDSERPAGVIIHLEDVMADFVGSTLKLRSNWYLTFSQIGFSGRSFYMAGPSGIPQLYWAGQTHAQSESKIEMQRRNLQAAVIAKDGFPLAAHVIAALNVIDSPEVFQSWIELGFSLIYENRKGEGIACLEKGVELNPYLDRKGFIQEQRAACPSPTPLTTGDPQKWFDLLLPTIDQIWLDLPLKHQLALVWIKSLTGHRKLQAVWFKLLDHYGTSYIGRELFRQLPETAQALYLSSLTPTDQSIFQAHLFD